MLFDGTVYRKFPFKNSEGSMKYFLAILILLGYSGGLFAKEIHRAKLENPTKCSVRINGTVNWRAEDRDSIATIKSNFVISGTMKMKWQAKGGYAKDFEIDQMQVNYSHLAQAIKKKPSKDCPESLEFEVKASGSLPITKGSLNIRYEGKVPAGHPIKQSMLDFGFGPGPVPGKMKTLDRCQYTTKELGLTIAQVKVIDTQKIANDQTEFSGSRSFGIPEKTSVVTLSLWMPFIFSDKVLSGGPSSLPKEIENMISSAGDNLVLFKGYSIGNALGGVPGNDGQLTWKIKIGPYVEIWRDDKDITDQVQDVVVGERIKLKAVVFPEDKDPKQGEWSIGTITPKSGGDYKAKKFIKDFVVSGETGQVIELKGEELEKPEIKFHWWDEGKDIKVKYKTIVEGKEVTGESTFVVRKPAITMSAETPQGVGLCYDFFDEDGTYDHSEMIYSRPDLKNIRTDPKNRIPTIKFTRTEIPVDFPGETQYVQVVQENGCWVKKADALEPRCLEIDRAGLDNDYPYTKEREALDTPGIQIADLDKEIKVVHKFKMYLEYKPAKEGAIFVPSRVTDWEWKGAMKWDPQAKEPNCNVTRTDKPKDKAAEEYAQWKRVLRPNTPWDPCKQEKPKCPKDF
jgi:hypothetical protein